MTKADPTINPFLRFLERYRVLLSAVAGIGTASAVISSTIGPPWPPSGGVATLTGLTTTAFLAWSYMTWRGLDAGRLRRRANATLAVAIVLTILYVTLQAQLIERFDRPQPHAYVRGLVLAERARQALDDDEIPTSLRELIDGNIDQATHRHIPDGIWTDPSIALAKAGVLGAWIGLFLSISALLAILLHHLEGGASRPRATKVGSEKATARPAGSARSATGIK